MVVLCSAEAVSTSSPQAEELEEDDLSEEARLAPIEAALFLGDKARARPIVVLTPLIRASLRHVVARLLSERCM